MADAEQRHDIAVPARLREQAFARVDQRETAATVAATCWT